MPSADAQSLRRIGRILRAHGVLGELKVLPALPDDEVYTDLERVWLGDTPEEAAEQAVESVRFQHNAKGRLVLLGLTAITDRDAAESQRGRSVFAAASDLPAPEGETYDVDLLVGLEVHAEGQRIGRVAEVLDMPAHPTLVIEREGRPDALVPAVPAFIETIDPAAGLLVIRPIDGLLDD
ncbi:MAG: ribosome maturation factor RimM [Rhodothermales bacterium]